MRKSRANSLCSKNSKIPISVVRTSSVSRYDEVNRLSAMHTKPPVQQNMGSSRKQSMMPSSACSSSQAANQGRDVFKDPRPVTDKAFKDACSRNLLNFLLARNYPYVITSKSLQSPSNSDFKKIVEFLISFLPFPKNYKLDGKLEDSFPNVMSILKYPIVIPKRYLQTVGAPHQWPYLLASLDYIRHLIENVRNPYEQILASLSDEEREFLKFTDKTYVQYLRGVDEFDEDFALLTKNLIHHPNLKEENEKLKDRLNKLVADVEIANMKLKANREDREKKKRALSDLEGKLENLCKLNKMQMENLNILAARRKEKAKKIESMDEKIEEMTRLVRLREEEEQKQNQLGFNVNTLDSERTRIISEFENMEASRKELVDETNKLMEQRTQKREMITNKWVNLRKVLTDGSCLRFLTKEEDDVIFGLRFDLYDGAGFDGDVVKLKNLVLNQIIPRMKNELDEMQKTIHSSDVEDLNGESMSIEREIKLMDEVTGETEDEMARLVQEHKKFVGQKTSEIKKLQKMKEKENKKLNFNVTKSEEEKKKIEDLEKEKVKMESDFEEEAVKMTNGFNEQVSKTTEEFLKYRADTYRQMKRITGFLYQVAGVTPNKDNDTSGNNYEIEASG